MKGRDDKIKYTNEDLKTMQAWPLERKIQVTQLRIMEWYMRWEEKVYISFSGGKDSTVLLDLARRIYPNIVAVFIDTGLEYPEVRKFALSKENVIRITPKIPFNKVIEQYGYPVISKEVSGAICGARSKPNGYEAQKFDEESDYIKKYGKRYYLGRYKYLLDSDIKISGACCNQLKNIQ
jgi:3'-phosphoadenosine 5'-phosphosulfate sulfotransferase (PAPS reductase)/FAD synthetase